MNIKKFISEFDNYPILFLGSGFSLRYLKESYSWNDLLKKADEFLTGTDKDFLRSRNNHTSDDSYNYEDVASDLEILYEDILDSTNNINFSELNDRYYEYLRHNIHVSRLKIHISDMVSNLELTDNKKDEFQYFIRASNNISSIVTTNYDKLVESHINFKPYVGNDILLSNPYGALYKIHGSVESPESIIITSGDYKKFNEQYELIRAQLISLFIHNPIIFMGYSLHDKDINNILTTIFKYVDFNSPIAEKIKKNFLVVEYEPGSDNQEVQELDLIIKTQTIKVNKLTTDDFTPIYNAIENLKLPYSAMDIRKLRNIVTDIYEGTSNIKVKIFEDIDSLNNSDKVLAIGAKWMIRYETLHAKDFIKDYFSIIDENNVSKIRAIDSIQIASTQFFPIYGFLSLYPQLNKANDLKNIENEKFQSIEEKVNSNNKYVNSYTSIQEVLNDTKIPKSNKLGAIQYGVINRNISLENLKEELINDMEDYVGTGYNSLIVIYDFIKYNSNI